jgi:hypothetical protein
VPFRLVEMMSPGQWRQLGLAAGLTDTAIDDRDAGVCETAQGSLLAQLSRRWPHRIFAGSPARSGNRFIDLTAERIAA